MLNGHGELPAFPVRVACERMAAADDSTPEGLLSGAFCLEPGWEGAGQGRGEHQRHTILCNRVLGTPCTLRQHTHLPNPSIYNNTYKNKNKNKKASPTPSASFTTFRARCRASTPAAAPTLKATSPMTFGRTSGAQRC